MIPIYFEVKEEHLKLLQRMYSYYADYSEFGAPEIDPKRPYGNSGSFIYVDMENALGNNVKNVDEISEERKEELHKFHKETATALQICLYFQEFKTGEFRRPNQYNTRVWEKIK